MGKICRTNSKKYNKCKKPKKYYLFLVFVTSVEKRRGIN